MIPESSLSVAGESHSLYQFWRLVGATEQVSSDSKPFSDLASPNSHVQYASMALRQPKLEVSTYLIHTRPENIVPWCYSLPIRSSMKTVSTPFSEDSAEYPLEVFFFLPNQCYLTVEVSFRNRQGRPNLQSENHNFESRQRSSFSNTMLEVCCYNAQSAQHADRALANRIEFCANPSVGGVTPKLEDYLEVKSQCDLPINVMIRPRGGNFVYSAAEIDQMKADIERFRPAMRTGSFVFGILLPNGRVDVETCKELVQLARPKSCNFHKAIDETPDILQAIDDVLEAGFSQILSSGGQKDALAGKDTLIKMIERAGTIRKGAIIVGGGVRSTNIKELVTSMDAQWYHSSALIDGSEIASLDEVKQLLERQGQAKEETSSPESRSTEV
jgi:copper homeostasis protein